MTLRRLAAGALALFLAGCQAVQAPGMMPVAGGAVVVAGPSGFCVDPGASHDSARGAFVLLGSCRSISGSSFLAQAPPLRAVLTAAVSAGSGGASIAGNTARLSRFFRSRAGRAALSRSGNPETVRVLSERVHDNAFILHARDVSAFPGHAVSPDYWRALFDLNGHIVTLSVIGVPQAPFTDTAALDTLEAFIARVRALSPPNFVHREAAAAEASTPAPPSRSPAKAPARTPAPVQAPALAPGVQLSSLRPMRRPALQLRRVVANARPPSDLGPPLAPRVSLLPGRRPAAVGLPVGFRAPLASPRPRMRPVSG